MEEKINHLKGGSTEISQYTELDESFSLFSSEEEGLSTIPDKEHFEEILLSRKNISDIIYMLKFLADEASYEEIIASEAASFTRLSEEDREEVVKYTNIFYNTLNNPPTIYPFSEIKPNEKGIFIAYIYADLYSLTKTDQSMHIAWKADRENFRIFDELLAISEKSSEDFPQELRTTGNISIRSKGKKIYIDFFGNSRKGENIYIYCPDLLARYEEDIKDLFARKAPFKGKEIEIHF
jgi:hypothetical protein